ncbi:hypothetical protein AAOGI_20720 [Agarivorans albus]
MELDNSTKEKYKAAINTALTANNAIADSLENRDTRIKTPFADWLKIALRQSLTGLLSANLGEDFMTKI